MVDRSTNAEGRVEAVNPMQGLMERVTGTPWRNVLQQKGFAVKEDDLAPVFAYLEFCLKQIVADNELGGLMGALEGQYILPGPGGDPIRNPEVLPTGKNMHALDPQSIPTTAAVDCAKVVVDRLLERLYQDNGGKYPESIAFTLWGTDNIKTYGESLAQVLQLVGVRPIPDSLGRVNKLELIPLEELKRPRIDVVVSCSGVFRDLFINQMNLLDRGVKMAAEADEPGDMNFVRKHALEQAKELGVSLRDAATRVFSNAAGSYSANVGLAIENGGWEGEQQLQEQFLTRKGFAFNADRPGMMESATEIFKSSLARVDCTFQNLDSSEISLTDVSHYFDSDPTKVVSGLRKDGKKPLSMIADTTTANAQVTSPRAMLAGAVCEGLRRGVAGAVAVGDGAAGRADQAAQPQVLRGDAQQRVRGGARDHEAAAQHDGVVGDGGGGGQLHLRGRQQRLHPGRGEPQRVPRHDHDVPRGQRPRLLEHLGGEPRPPPRALPGRGGSHRGRRLDPAPPARPVPCCSPGSLDSGPPPAPAWPSVCLSRRRGRRTKARTGPCARIAQRGRGSGSTARP